MRDVLRNYWGLGMFGMAIGFMAALSTATGTSLTLFGLLFALIGGSLAPFFSRNAAQTVATFDAARRRELFNGLGLFSIGLIAGLCAGFTYQTLDSVWIAPSRMAPFKEQAAELDRLRGRLADEQARLEALLAKHAAADDVKAAVTSLAKDRGDMNKKLDEITKQLASSASLAGAPLLHAAPVEIGREMLSACDGLLEYIKTHPEDAKAQAARGGVEALRSHIRFDLDPQAEMAAIQELIDKDDKDHPLFNKSDFGSMFLRYKKALSAAKTPPAADDPRGK